MKLPFPEMDGQLFRIPPTRCTSTTPGALGQSRDTFTLSFVRARPVRRVILAVKMAKSLRAIVVKGLDAMRHQKATLSFGDHLLRRYNLAGQTEWQGGR